MILIQSQLCSIDQSDLFIPRSRGGWAVEINPAPPSLFSFLFFFPFCLTIPCMLKLQWLCTCLHNICSGVGGKNRRPSNQTDPGARGNLSSQADTSKFFCSLACCISLLACLFFWFVFLFFCHLPVSPPPHRRLASPRRPQDTKAPRPC